MANYKSIEAALRDLEPDLQKIGNVLSDEIQNYIEAGKVKGLDLTERTLNGKRPETRKLYHDGDLARGSIVNVNDDSVMIGYSEADKHNSKTSKSPLNLATLAEVNNEGILNKNVPERPFLFTEGEWLPEYKRAAQKEYERQLKNKGIL